MPDAAVDAKSKHDLGSADTLKAKSLHVRKLQKEAKEARHKAAAAKKKADAMPTRLAALKEKAVKKKKKLKKDKNKELNSGELGSADNLKAKSPHVSELQKEAKEARHKAAVAKKKADAMPDAAVDAKSKHD